MAPPSHTATATGEAPASIVRQTGKTVTGLPVRPSLHWCGKRLSRKDRATDLFSLSPMTVPIMVAPLWIS